MSGATVARISSDWHGDLPGRWDVLPASAVFTERKEASSDVDVHLTPSQKYGVLPQAEYMEITGNRVVLNLTGGDNMKHVEPGDFISHLRSFQGGLEYSRLAGKMSAAYTALRPVREICPDYFRHLFKSRSFVKALQSTTDQLRDGQSIRFAELKLIDLPFPPLPEQKAIADFLDRETAEIDEFVQTSEQLIELLNERRAAVITQAVTKGLDPTVPMKDSGIEWLGEVPEAWDVRKLSRAFRARKGKRAAALTKEYCATIPGDYPVFSGQTENGGVMASIDDYEFDAGDTGVLFSTTVGAKAMSVSHISGRFSLSQNCMIIGPVVPLALRYFYYQFQVIFSYEKSQIPQYMQASFRMEDLNQYRLPWPSITEQRAIADHLDHETAQIDEAITEARKGIELAKERRQALISAAVTGKIDVKEAV